MDEEVGIVCCVVGCAFVQYLLFLPGLRVTACGLERSKVMNIVHYVHALSVCQVTAHRLGFVSVVID